MMNARRRRQQADVVHQETSSFDDISDYPRISSRTGGYESSVASHLVSSASNQGSWSTAEDASTVKADNTTTATSQELMMFRIPALFRESPAPGSDGRKNKKAGPRQPAISSSKTSLSQQRSHASSSRGKQSSVDSSSTIKSNGPGDSGRVGRRAGGRTFLRKLVDNRQAFRVCRNNTEATVDAASDDSRSSPHRTRFVLPDNIVAPSPSMPGLKYAAQRKSSNKQQGSRIHPTNEQESDGYEVLSNPTNKTMTVVHSSLTLDSPLRSKQHQRMIVDSDLIDANCSDDSSSSSSFSQLLMTDGDLMKNQERFGTGAIRLTPDSLKEHEGKHGLNVTKKSNTTKQPSSPLRNNPFVFWRNWRCMDVDPVVPQLSDDEAEKTRIELKRQEYLKTQRQREFGSVTKEQRDSIFDSLVDTKSRATQSTTSSAASQVTPRCSGCPTTGAMMDTVSFWND